MATIPTSPGDVPATIVLAKRGDVLLKIGDSTESAASLLVASAVLSMASPVFEAMFNGGFEEGQTLSATFPREISLPDDNLECMTILCKIIHMQTNDVSLKLDLDTLADFAVLCNKYNCFGAVRPWIITWVTKWLSTPNVEIFGLEKLLFVSYVLDLPNEFYRITQVFVLDGKGPLRIELVNHRDKCVPMKVIDHIHQDQRRYHNLAIKNLQHSDSLLKINCERALLFHAFWFRALVDVEIFPFQLLSLSEYQARIQKLKLKDFAADLPLCGCQIWQRCSSEISFKDDIIGGMNQIFNSVKGQCLDCLYKEMGRVKQIVCRIEH